MLQPLNLTPTGSTGINTPSTGAAAETRLIYDVSLIILHPQYGANPPVPALVKNTIPVICTELFAAQGIHALIGRDVLQSCLLVYDGVNGTFSLAY